VPTPPAVAPCACRRAYKLGKRRWSYNQVMASLGALEQCHTVAERVCPSGCLQVELLLSEEGGSRQAIVRQAVAAGGAKLPEAQQVSCWLLAAGCCVWSFCCCLRHSGSQVPCAACVLVPR